MKSTVLTLRHQVYSNSIRLLALRAYPLLVETHFPGHLEILKARQVFGQLVVQIQVSSLTPDGYNFASATVYYFLSFSYLSVTQNSSNKFPNLLGNLRIFTNSPFWLTIHNPNAPQEAAWLPRQRCTLSSSRSVPGNRRWTCTSDTACGGSNVYD